MESHKNQSEMMILRKIGYGLSEKSSRNICFFTELRTIFMLCVQMVLLKPIIERFGLAIEFHLGTFYDFFPNIAAAAN